MRLTVGCSSDPSASGALAAAAREAFAGASDPTFAFVFSTDQYDHDALALAVNSELGDLPWAGCCTAGVFGKHRLLSQGVAIGVVSSPDTLFRVGVGSPVSADGRAAGRAAAAEALSDLPPRSEARARSLILLPDALTGNSVDVVRGAAAEAGSGIAWAGGGAGDNLRFVRTAQYAHGRALRDHVVAIAVDSPVPLGTGVRHGWEPYGPAALVTCARGATVLELEYEKAFDVYRRAAARRGDEVSADSFAEFAMSHPLGIPQADGEYVIRDPLSVDEEGGLRCVADVPDGSLVRVMQANEGALLRAAETAATQARESTAGALGGALVFECVSRPLVLREGVSDELSALRRALGEEVPVLGCLTFGEIGALGSGVPQLHNKAVVVLALPAA
jgi:hypothetical protein